MYRNISLDALRGLAIIGMVLSGSIAHGGILPAWMFHAQVPPPNHVFNPALPGITWVDLVFPFFLFAMGMAMPMAGKKFAQLLPMQVVMTILKRFALLAFFALFTQQMKAWVVTDEPTTYHYFIPCFAFAVLDVLLANTWKLLLKPWMYWVLWPLVLLGWWFMYHLTGKPLNLYKSDIILLVLANMALFGTFIYYFTTKNILARWSAVAVVMAVFITAKSTSSGWVHSVFYWNRFADWKIDWLYKFYFLKYLAIVIPGSIMGNYVLTQAPNNEPTKWAGLLSFLLVIISTTLLYTRHTEWNALISLTLAVVIYTQWRSKISSMAVFLLLLGLILEAHEGGVKKDPSTFSYYFITAALAIYTWISLTVLQTATWGNKLVTTTAAIGANPLVAYVAGSLLLLPILHITGGITYFNALNTTPFIGFVKGVLFTSLVCLLAIIYTKRNRFWKT